MKDSYTLVKQANTYIKTARRGSKTLQKTSPLMQQHMVRKKLTTPRGSMRSLKGLDFTSGTPTLQTSHLEKNPQNI